MPHTFYTSNTLVNITDINPNIRVHMPYTTVHNFTGKQIYESNICYLQQEAAEKLSLVQKEFETMDLGLLVWDGYRPLSAQQKFWDLMPDERYVADPKKGSRHNRGAAIDVTLINRDGKELLMPTRFDDFTEKAHRDYMNLPQEAIYNRNLLEHVMEKHGFIGWSCEWWHFDLANWENYPLLDISL